MAKNGRDLHLEFQFLTYLGLADARKSGTLSAISLVVGVKDHSMALSFFVLRRRGRE